MRSEVALVAAGPLGGCARSPGLTAGSLTRGIDPPSGCSHTRGAASARIYSSGTRSCRQPRPWGDRARPPSGPAAISSTSDRSRGSGAPVLKSLPSVASHESRIGASTAGALQRTERPRAAQGSRPESSSSSKQGGFARRPPASDRGTGRPSRWPRSTDHPALHAYQRRTGHRRIWLGTHWPPGCRPALSPRR